MIPKQIEVDPLLLIRNDCWIVKVYSQEIQGRKAEGSKKDIGFKLKTKQKLSNGTFIEFVFSIISHVHRQKYWFLKED